MQTSIEACPALQVDWESGEGQVCLGEQLTQSHPRFKYDVLADWKVQIDQLLGACEADLYPQRRLERTRVQRLNNRRRRSVCEALSGATVELAEPLVNGDVLLHLANG